MKRSKLSLSHYKLLSCNMGNLIPLTWYEALPGDTIQMSTAALVRVAPLLAPVMHPVLIRIHNWFVPNRLLWEDWEDFITGGPDGTFEASPPHFDTNAWTNVPTGSLEDYMGIPTGDYAGTSHKVSALPFRAYNLIYNEHYRDQDLCSERVVATASGEDTTTDRTLASCAWEKDYFTTARPWESKGEEITLPMGTQAPVYGPSNLALWKGNPDGGPFMMQTDANVDTLKLSGTVAAGSRNWEPEGWFADLADATAITVNDLRLALALQRYQEARAQYGSRYVEYLRHEFGVRSSDARLQNPEYLGGGRQVIQFSEVLATAQGTDTNVGDLKGHGIAAMRTRRSRRFFEEHGIVMTIMSVLPKSIYMQALPRKWHRLNKEMYFQKELQYLGDQQIPTSEVNVFDSQPVATFGYGPRYDEYRSMPSEVSGEFRDILNYWHYAREFSADVALNSSFVTSTPTKRVYASTDNDCLYIMANHSIQARRCMKRSPKPRTF